MTSRGKDGRENGNEEDKEKKTIKIIILINSSININEERRLNDEADTSGKKRKGGKEENVGVHRSRIPWDSRTCSLNFFFSCKKIRLPDYGYLSI